MICFFLEHESAIDVSLTMIRSGECHEGSQDVKNGVVATGCCFKIVSRIHLQIRVVYLPDKACPRELSIGERCDVRQETSTT